MVLDKGLQTMIYRPLIQSKRLEKNNLLRENGPDSNLTENICTAFLIEFEYWA